MSTGHAGIHAGIPPSGSHEHVGATQLAVLARAAGDVHGMVMSDWRNNVEVCAIKRLVRRDLLKRGTFGTGSFVITVYTITDAGRTVLARSREGSAT